MICHKWFCQIYMYLIAKIYYTQHITYDILIVFMIYKKGDTKAITLAVCYKKIIMRIKDG